MRARRWRGLHAQGVEGFCLSLDPEADRYVQRIFGGRHVVVDHLQRCSSACPVCSPAPPGEERGLAVQMREKPR